MKEKVVIVGAGLCGTMLAIRMAERGYQVELHEKRPDMRLEEMSAGRSINLALSNRGLKALEMIGLADEVKQECIPMLGRMIHSKTGETRLSKYSGRDGDFINSVSRGGLNISLLIKADSYKNLNITFNSRCNYVDLKSGTAQFQDMETGEAKKVVGDIVIGTDGAGSAVRRSLMSHTTELLFNYSQDFLRHGYKELSIPPDDEGGWRIDKNSLHIWPRGGMMVIALPNMDGSFTVTMFHPFEGEGGFNTLDTDDKLLAHFKSEYPDLLEHMPDFLADYHNNPSGNLGTIKCYPWQAYGKTLIMGDAAHAVVPFYGQGMNASFEDVFVFDEILTQHVGDWSKVFTEFEDARVANTNAIADLAIDNFYEMRDHVANPVFIKKRKLEMDLEHTFPDYFSKYSMVTFNADMPYAEAMRKGRLQDKLLMDICESNHEKTLAEVYEMLKKIV